VIAFLLLLRSWRFEIELAFAVLVVGLLTFYVINHLEGVGAEKCESANTDARVAELVRDATARTRDAESINREASIYAATLAAPLGAPVFAPPGLCRVTAATSTSTRRMPAAAPSGRVSDGAAALPSVDRGDADHAVLVPETLRITGRQADAQVIELQTYIRDVCRPSPAP
jgi:hypothetical protein